MELLLGRGIIFAAAVIIVNYRPAVMPPVMPLEFPMAIKGSMPPVAVAVRCPIMMPLVEFWLEAVHRSMVVMVALMMIAPPVAPVKFVDSRFIPFLKMAAAIPVTVADSFTPGP